MTQMMRIPRLLFNTVRLNRRVEFPHGKVHCQSRGWFFRREVCRQSPVKSLSLSGLEFVSPTRLAPGKKVYLQVDLPITDVILKFQGRVMLQRVDGAGYSTAIQFDSVSPATLNVLRRLLFD